MSRKIALILAIALVFSLLGACSTGSESSEPANSQSASSAAGNTGNSGEKIQLRFWMRNSDDNHWANRFFKQYNSEQDEVELIYEAYGENYDNVISIALASDEPPEMFEAQNNPPVVKLAEAGHIVPIDDLFDEKFKSQFHPSAFAQKDLYYNGELYSIPCRFSAFKLLYNKGLFEKAGLDPESPPETWEQVREYAQKITQAGNGDFYGYGVYVNYPNWWMRNLDAPMVEMGESGLFGFDYATGRFDFSKSKKMFQFWVDLYNDGSTFPGALELGIEQMRANFAQSKVGMMIDGNWMSSQYEDMEDVIADWSCTEIPIFEDAKRGKGYMVGEETFVIAKNNKYLEKTKEIYKIMMEIQPETRKDGDAQCKCILSANTPESYALLPKDRNYVALEEQLRIDNNAAFSVEPYKFIVVEGADRNAVFNSLIASAFDGDTSTWDSTVQDLTDRYNAALDKALADGTLTEEDVKPEGFDYFNR